MSDSDLLKSKDADSSSQKGEEKVRASIAGHSFHWYIAVREALALFSHDCDFTAIGLEGGSASIAGCEIADLIYYHGSQGEKSSQDWVQIKYSRKKRDEAFTWSFMRPTLAKFLDIYIKRNTDSHFQIDNYIFLTNRPAQSALASFFELSKANLGKHEFFTKVSKTLTEDVPGVSQSDLLDFISKVRLRDNSRGLEDTVKDGRRQIGRFIPGHHPDGVMAVLFEKVVACARSENAGDRRVSRETVLMWLGYADPMDLLPAPAKFTPVINPLPRLEIEAVETHLATQPERPLLITAPGGVGKTVFMQQIADKFETEHEVVLFDCFAGGEYRYAEDARHREEIGLTQIINTLSSRGLSDPFLRPVKSPHFLRAVRQRLENAAARIAEEQNGSRLIIMLDAADNSAQQGKDQRESSFPCWLYQTLSDQPIKGVSLIVSCRDYRIDLITLKVNPPRLNLPPFDRPLTYRFLETRDSTLEPNARACLFAQSGGVPRVLDYLLRTGLGGANQPLNMVTVENILDARVDSAMDALDHGGAKSVDRSAMLTALVRLPPPISIDTLSIATGIAINNLDSFVTALMPLIIRTTEGVTFRDEDAEVWARLEAEKHADAIVRLTERLDQAQESSIAASYALPPLLFEQGKFQELINLALSERFPPNLSGRVAQQRLRARRLNTALKSATLAKDLSMAVRLLFELAMVRTTESRTDGFVCSKPALAALSDSTQIVQRLTRPTLKEERRAFLSGRRLIAAASVGNIDRAEIEARRYDENLMTEGGRLDESDTDALAAMIVLDVLRGDACRAVRQTARVKRPSVQYAISSRLLWFLQSQSVSFDPLCSAILSSRRGDNHPDVRGLALALLIHPKTMEHFRRPLAKIASQEWGAGEFSLPKERYKPVESPGINMAQALVRGALQCVRLNFKSAARRCVKAVEAPNPSLRDFSSDFSSERMTEFFALQCIKAFLRGHALRPKDCLPPKLSSLAAFQGELNLDEAVRSLEALHKAQNLKSKKRGGRKGVLAHSDETDLRALIWTVRELYTVGSQWMLNWSTEQKLEDIRMSEWLCERLIQEPSDYRLYQKRASQTRLRTKLCFVCLSTIPSTALSGQQYFLSVTNHLVAKTQYGLQIRWTTWLALYPNLADAALHASQAAKSSVLANTSVESRIIHLGWIADAIAICDRTSSSALVDDILDTLDGVGGDDHEILNGLLSIAQKQPGGRVPKSLAQRFLDVCEIHIHEEDKFPWPELGHTARSFGSGDILARLSRWDGRDIAKLSASLGLVLEALVNSEHLSPEHAYALSAIAPTAYWIYRRPATSASAIALKCFNKRGVSKAFHRQLIIRHGANEGQSFADAINEAFDTSPDWGGFGFWIRQEPQPGEDNVPSYREDNTIDLESVPEIEMNQAASMTDCVDALLGHPDISYPYAQSDALILWGRENVNGPESRRDYILAISSNSDLSFWAAGRAIRHLSADWSDFLPDIEILRRRCADERLRASLAAQNKTMGSLMSDYASLSGLEIGTAAAHCLDAILQQRVDLGTEDAFVLANALMNTAPDQAHAAFVSLLSAPTLCLPQGQGESGEDEAIAGCASDMDAPTMVAAFIWAQMGHGDALNRLGAGHAVQRLAELGQLDCLEALVDTVDTRPRGDMWPLGVKYPIISARGALMMAIERSAASYPDKLSSIEPSLQSLRSRLDLSAAEQRALDNALESLAAHRESRAPLYNQTPLSAHKRIPPPADRWASGRSKPKKKFSFDYDFQKSEPSWTARMFGGDTVLDTPAIDQLINAIHEIDPDLDSMHDDGGGMRDQSMSRHREHARFRRYGEQVVYTALEQLGSRWLKQHPLIDDGYDDDEAENWLKSTRPTSKIGVWLSDQTDLPPSFVSIPSVKTGNTPLFHDLEPLLGALGLSESKSVGLVLAGRWRPSGGGGLSIFSALTRTWGSVKACTTFAKRPWHDAYMPSLYHTRLHGESGRTSEGFQAWLDEYEPEPQGDRWDPFGSTAACRPFRLGSQFRDSLGLRPHQSGVYNCLKSERAIVAASAWGRDLSSSRHDADTTGKALLADRKHIFDWLSALGLSLIFKLERSYTHRGQWDRGPSERLEANHLIKLTPGQATRIWKLPSYKSRY